MASRGPSPLVPSLVVGALGLIICRPTLLSLLEISVSLFQVGAETDGRANLAFVMLLLFLLLLFVHFVSSLFPTIVGMSNPIIAVNQTSSTSESGGDGFEFGMGTVLLVLLFLVLYHVV